jgi:DNA adenine methylase
MKETQNPKPFLRWAGGKRWLLKYLEPLSQIEFNNYYEPFLGGGSVFFNTNNYKYAVLSDLNKDLIETYNCIKEDVDLVINRLKTLKNSESEYYEIREKEYSDSFSRAAKFIFLNKTSYNGIYRVNRDGKFNVPYGFRNNLKDIIEEENLKIVSKKLQNTSIFFQDFACIAETVTKGDIIFLDPPYTVAHENNGFIQYNQKIFSLEDQVRLSKLIEVIIEKEAFYILTNAKHEAILEIYKNIDAPKVLTRSSTIGGKGARRESFNEFVFSNIL